MVNSTDQRGPLPIEPIDPSAQLRHGEYNNSNSHVAAGPGRIGANSRGLQSFGRIDLLWSGPSASCQFSCTVNMSTPGVFEERAVDYMGRVEVSISAVPAATHVPVSVTSYYTDANITCAAEYAVRGSGLSFSVLFQKWKNG